MIITEKMNITVAANMMRYYRELGYIVSYKDCEIEINTKDLKKGSGQIVEIKCDVCGEKSFDKYCEYIKNIKNDGFYTCNGKCRQIKRKKTMFQRYGVEHALQLKENLDKAKKTCLNRYGNEYYRNYDKVRKTNLENFGVEYGFQNEIVKNKIKQTNMKNLGCEWPTQNDKVKEKIKSINRKNLGCDWPMSNDIVYNELRLH